MGVTGPSFRLDPGWLFVAAGLTLCVAGVLIPAQQSLDDLGGQMRRLEHLHATGRDGVAAHERFLDRLRQRDPAVFRRLAAAQLNLVPAGDTPLLVAISGRATVTDWIGRSVMAGTIPATATVRTWLTRLTDGTRRLWLLGFGVLVVFVGLLVDGRPPNAPGNVEWTDDASDEDEEADGDWGAPGEEKADEDEDDEDGDDDFDDEDEEYEADDEEEDADWDEEEDDDDDDDAEEEEEEEEEKPEAAE